jgi:hypothetical protein
VLLVRHAVLTVMAAKILSLLLSCVLPAFGADVICCDMRDLLSVVTLSVLAMVDDFHVGYMYIRSLDVALTDHLFVIRTVVLHRRL